MSERQMDDGFDFVTANRIMLAVAEACWRKDNPSQSWHVFEWMAWKIRCRCPVLLYPNSIINWQQIT